MEIKNVFIVGSGFMGNGIAQVSALAGYRVRMSDVDEESCKKGMDTIQWSLDKLRSKQRITQEQYNSALKRLSTTIDLEEARDADIAVEAIPENLELKKDVFVKLDEICSEHTILATNTSAIPITYIASATKRPDRVVGTHFFGPVPLMRLCEIIPGLLTSHLTLTAAAEWAGSLGKETVMVKKDRAGFIANRVNIPACLEAIRIVQQGIATPGQIDEAVTAGIESTAGPMQIMDNAGLDVILSTTEAIYSDSGSSAFLPPGLLVYRPGAGRKEGQGFYSYVNGKREDTGVQRSSHGKPLTREDVGDLDEKQKGEIVQRLFLPSILEAIRVLDAGVGSLEDIDRATRLGFNFPAGPLESADNIGLDNVLNSSENFDKYALTTAFSPPPLLRRMVAAGLLGRKTGKGFYEYDDVRK